MKIVFQFEGGFLDGKTIAGHDDLWHRYMFLTRGGQVGARFRDHQNHIGTSDQRVSVFIREMVALGIDLNWLGGWFARIERRRTSDDEVQQKFLSYLAKHGIELPARWTPLRDIIQVIAEESRSLRGEAHVYEVASREIIDDEIRVRVKLVSEETID